MALSKLAVRRLTKLADYMETVPRGHFSMRAWFRHNGPDHHRFGKVVSVVDLGECGTTACAFGWATTIPAFRKAGLRLAVGDGQFGSIVLRNKEYEGADAIGVAAEFFGLSKDDTRHLFGDSIGDEELTRPNPTTPKQWTRLCRKLLRENA